MSHIPERVVLEEDGITVTTARIQAKGTRGPGVVIPLSGLACVYEFGMGAGARAKRSLEAWILAAYLGALFLVQAGMGGNTSWILIGLASLAFVMSRPIFPVWRALTARNPVLEVCDAGGRVHAIRVSNFGVGTRVYEAICAAIAERGAGH